MRIELDVNNERPIVDTPPNSTLAEVLRNELSFKSVKIGCDMGECGSCTVLMDGEPVSSCLVLAASAEGRNITTVEGLSKNGELHPIQKAFLENHAFQCGWCTPGMILVIKALLEENPNPSREEIKKAISGNICRCGSYQKIIDAAEDAAHKMMEED